MIYIKRFCWVIFITFFSVLTGCAFLVNALIIQPCVMFYYYMRIGDMFDVPDTIGAQVDMTVRLLEYLRPTTNEEIKRANHDNMNKYLDNVPILFFDHVRDKKGKLISVKAKFEH